MRWLELPGEIRQLVYKWHFEDASILIHESDGAWHDFCRPTPPYDKRRCSSIDFLLTCKTIYAEAWPIFLKSPSFVAAQCLFDVVSGTRLIPYKDGTKISFRIFGTRETYHFTSG